MAENDSSWFPEDNSCRKTTCHGGIFQSYRVNEPGHEGKQLAMLLVFI